MQVGMNQDAAVRQYTQNVQSVNATTAPAAAEKKADASAGAVKKDVDQAEFSKDTSVATKMSDSQRAALVKSLKDDLNSQMSRFTNMMTQMFQKQGITANFSEGNDFWRMMASGNYTVDEKTKAEAQEAISEDGYWDDPDKMKEMQAAVEKGFKQAGEAWGGDLPSICGDTHTAVNKLFDDYYAKSGKTA